MSSNNHKSVGLKETVAGGATAAGAAAATFAVAANHYTDAIDINGSAQDAVRAVGDTVQQHASNVGDTLNKMGDTLKNGVSGDATLGESLTNAGKRFSENVGNAVDNTSQYAKDALTKFDTLPQTDKVVILAGTAIAGIAAGTLVIKAVNDARNRDNDTVQQQPTGQVASHYSALEGRVAALETKEASIGGQ